MRLAYPPYLVPALQRHSRKKKKKLGLDLQVELENNFPVFSLGSQLQQEAVSLIVPIVVVMANSP